MRDRDPGQLPGYFGALLVSHHAALACHMANEAYFRNAAVTWDAASGKITS
jgi:hypothetical protein